MKKKLTIFLILALSAPFALLASETNLNVPEAMHQQNVLYIGFVICFLGLVFGFYRYLMVKKLKAHQSMLDVSNIIFETCKTYLIQQGKFLVILFSFIAICVAFYFGYLQNHSLGDVLLILLWSVIGIMGSYSVAWYGIRMNTFANSRMAFSALENKPLKLLKIPLDAGISIGVVLISVELIMMLYILMFIPGRLAGSCFIGFAIGESLGASALRIAGGIFTKIADIGSDLMKVVFKIKEDDPRNPGVIADCTGDNAGDSVGPSADGFETYGVTGVALISFIILAVKDINFQVELLTWIFAMRVLMIATSVASYYVNKIYSNIRYGKTENLDFEQPLTNLVWITSISSIIITFIISYLMIGSNSLIGTAHPTLWYILSAIISFGTLGAALIPEVTKIFTSPKSAHVREVVASGREGGASLVILSGLVAGNFSAFWKGMVFLTLMFGGYMSSKYISNDIMVYSSIFAFGLGAFGMLGMGPVTIAVDSYGPVTDNAQSVYELSLIETLPNIEKEIEEKFGFKPNFKKAKHHLEENDEAGNTFKATAKPVLIGTAVVGATTMIFSLILVIKSTLGIDPETVLNLLNPWSLLGFLAGGSVIYWFTGASMQAVTVGAYNVIEYIKKNIHLDKNADLKASIETSKEVVKICTKYAQSGMLNIFIAIFSFALAFAFLAAPWGNPEGYNKEKLVEYYAPVSLFVSYLIAIAIFGLFQAIFMANAGGCWDNAKKVVEVDLNEKGTPLHDACIVGDTVGDPFKDTSSVALNPVIKFTTLFGLLAMEIAINKDFRATAHYFGFAFLLVAFIFVWRSFYKMRIEKRLQN
jgi:K(+)-stimulated pyrophosphate-energized sodium pump